MFASPQNIQQDQTSDDPFIYPEGSSLQNTTDIPVPPTQPETKIEESTSTVPNVNTLEENSPVVENSVAPQPEVLIEKNTETEIQISQDPVPAPLQTEEALVSPKPVIVNTEAENRRRELEKLIKRQEAGNAQDVPLQAPTQEFLETAPKVNPMIGEQTMQEPVIEEEPLVETAKPETKEAMDDTTRRLSELEQRIVKLEQTVNQWV